MADTHHDLVIIGSGTGRLRRRDPRRSARPRRCVVEKDPYLGGTCLHRGCIPTKALLHTADLLQHARDGAKFGVVCGEVALDLKAAHDHKRRVVTKNAKGVEFLFKKNKVTLGAGDRPAARRRRRGGHEGGRHDREAQATTSSSPPARVAATSRTSRPTATGSSTPTTPSSSRRSRRRLLVLGAGAVGMEFASIFSRFGAKVTVVELLDRALPARGPRRLGRGREGVPQAGDHRPHRRPASRRSRWRAGSVTLPGHDRQGRAARTLEAERLLLAVGRVAVLDGIGLENTKVQVERGRVVVDEFCRTAEPGVYAIGDLTPTPWLAHVASAEGIVAVEHLAGKNPPPINYRPGPVLHLLLPRGRLHRAHRGAGEGAGLRRARRRVPVLRERQGGDPRRNDRLREDRRRREVRRDPRRPHRRPARHRADRRGRGGPARRADRRGAGPHDPRPPDARTRRSTRRPRRCTARRFTFDGSAGEAAQREEREGSDHGHQRRDAADGRVDHRGDYRPLVQE